MENCNKNEDYFNFCLPRKISFLINFSLIPDPSKPRCLSDFERFLNFSTPQPDIRNIIKELIKKDVFCQVDEVFGIKRYKIHLKKLLDLIDNMDCTNKYYKYFNKNHIAIK